MAGIEDSEEHNPGPFAEEGGLGEGEGEDQDEDHGSGEG